MQSYETYRSIYNRAAHFYRQHHEFRKYHNIKHALNVVTQCEMLGGAPINLSLKLAAMWHDAIYYPLCPGNEEASARALYLEAKVFGEENSAIIQEAMLLIKSTTIAHHLTTARLEGLLAVLLDADLSSLSADFTTFCKAQDSILLENYVDVKELQIKREKSAGFLMRFLVVRPYIYHTDAARSLFEELAKNNIIEYCGRYLPNFSDHLINMKNDHEREYGRAIYKTVQ